VYNAWFNAGVSDSDRLFYSTQYTSRYLAAGNYQLSDYDNYGDDWYRFTAQAGNEISVSATMHFNDGSARLRYYDQLGNLISSSDYIGNGSSTTLAHTPTLDGIYYSAGHMT
jgi:hypothetical protein